ncbi:hypothetical protein FB45DRAFT_936393, partial [Roridomyces roridus]
MRLKLNVNVELTAVEAPDVLAPPPAPSCIISLPVRQAPSPDCPRVAVQERDAAAAVHGGHHGEDGDAWTSADLFNEDTWLFSICFYLLIQRRMGSHSKRSVLFLVNISIDIILACLFQGSIAKAKFGGPAAFEAAEFSIPVDEIENVAFVLTDWFSDALLL